tara:strand:+ start:439 stop:804 length:366 start_codon:yes stop_codon:yes gene_type:complete
MKLNKFILITLVTLFILPGCKSVKDGLTGKKQVGADEFLVKKKNPLVLPPDYFKLPVPINENEALSKKDSEELSEFDIEKIIKENSGNKINKSNCENNSSQSECVVSKSLEKSVLKKINDN